MNINIIMVMNYTFRIIMTLCALYMAINDIDGWGWFLFVAAITGLSTSSKKDGDVNDKI